MRQRTARRYPSLVLVLVPLLASCVDDPTSVNTGLFDPDKSVAENIDEYITSRIADDYPGVAVRVVQDGEVLFHSAYGLLRRDEPDPAVTSTPFYLAEVSMQFTAVAALMLYEDGLLDLDAPVSDILPDIPSSWSLITVRHLLGHRSGVPDYLVDLDLGEAGLTNEAVVEELLGAPLRFVAGSNFVLSRSNYLLLAQVIEAVAEEPFEDFVQERIFDPLGMSDAAIVTESSPEIPGRAVGYSTLDTLGDYELLTLGDGGIYASLDDMGTWVEAIQSNALLSPETTALMYEPNDEGVYGLGWFLSTLLGEQARYHEGAHRGFRSFVGRLPDLDLTIVLLASGAYQWAFDLPGLIVVQILDA